MAIKNAEKSSYHVVVQEKHLDVFGHMNNAVYLELFEAARWDIISARGFDVEHIQTSKLGPVLLEINIRFKKELLLNTKVTITTQCTSVEGKISKLTQEMFNEKNESCCVAVFTLAVFNIVTRKIVEQPPEWLHAMGVTLEN